MPDQPPAPAQFRRVPQIGMKRAATCRNGFRRLLDDHERQLSDLRDEHERLLDKLYLDEAKYRQHIRRLEEFTENLVGEDLLQDRFNRANLWDPIEKYYQKQLTKVKDDINHENGTFGNKEKKLAEDIKSLKAEIWQLNAVIRSWYYYA